MSRKTEDSIEQQPRSIKVQVTTNVPMVGKHPLSLSVYMLMGHVGRRNLQASKKALLIAADYIRSGDPMPKELAGWLADAIDDAILKPEKIIPQKPNCGDALLVALNLKSNNRRQVTAAPWAIFEYCNQLMGGTRLNAKKERIFYKQTEALKITAKEFSISLSTARNLYKEGEQAHRDAIEALDKITPPYEPES